MEDILYLTHRIPYPPNKGDKIRSFHLLKHLSHNYRVHLGTFVDDKDDWKHVDMVKSLCAETYFANLNPMVARLHCLPALFTHDPLTLAFYKNNQLQDWVNTLIKTKSIHKILIFSAAMAQFTRHHTSLHRVIDLVDIDSDKWRQYAETKAWPQSWIYQRESKLLLDYEKQITHEFDSTCFVSEKEANTFQQLAPEDARKVTYFNNGVDTDSFSPHNEYVNPYPDQTEAIVFTGAMDYWANIDAVVWFAREIFPQIFASRPNAHFYIVGNRPNPQVRALASLSNVTITGFVEETKPYLAYAAVVVAPLRIARGIQNKVLEAMSMGKVVITSPQALEGINATPEKELYVEDNEKAFAQRVKAVLQSCDTATIGQAARSRILSDYSWDNSLMRVDQLLSKSLKNQPG